MDEQQVALILGTVWAVLTVLGRWFLFRKAGKPGLFSIIPIVSTFTEYSICWNGWMVVLSTIFFVVFALFGQAAQDQGGLFLLIAAAAGIAYLIILWTESMKLARSFGKGFFYGLMLFLFGRVFRVLLGLSAAEYIGKP